MSIRPSVRMQQNSSTSFSPLLSTIFFLLFRITTLVSTGGIFRKFDILAFWWWWGWGTFGETQVLLKSDKDNNITYIFIISSLHSSKNEK